MSKRHIVADDGGYFSKSSIVYRYFLNNHFLNKYSNAIHIGTCLLGGILAFLPLIASKKWNVHFDALDRLGLYRSSSSVALTLLIPMGVETLLEIYYQRNGPMLHHIKLSMDALSVVEKLMLMAGLAIAPSIGAFNLGPMLHVEDNLSLIYMCCRKSQNILVLGTVMTSLSRYQSQYWHGPTTTVCMLGLIIGQVVSLYYNLNILEGNHSTSLYLTMLFFSISSLVLFYLMTCRWGYESAKAVLMSSKTTPSEVFVGESKAALPSGRESQKGQQSIQGQRGNQSNRGNQDNRGNQSQQGQQGQQNSRARPSSQGQQNSQGLRSRGRSGEVGSHGREAVPSSTIEQSAFDSQAHQNGVYPYIYISLSIMCFTGLMVLMIQFTLNFVVTDDNLFGMNVAYIVFEILLLIYALRKGKFDIFQALCAVKEAKQIFVRYISHELRTPLNTAFLGLKLLVDDFKDSDDEVDKDRFDTIEAINQSVLYAVEILNGILTFDRIEAGMMELKQQDVFVVAVVSDCVNGFRQRAIDEGMQLRLLMPTIDRPGHAGSGSTMGNGFGNASVHEGAGHKSGRGSVMELNSLLGRIKSAVSPGNSLNSTRMRMVAPRKSFLSFRHAGGGAGLSGAGSGAPDPDSLLKPGELAVSRKDVAFADDLKLRRVVDNLISNAIKFGKRKVTVRMTFVPDPVKAKDDKSSGTSKGHVSVRRNLHASGKEAGPDEGGSNSGSGNPSLKRNLTNFKTIFGSLKGVSPSPKSGPSPKFGSLKGGGTGVRTPNFGSLKSRGTPIRGSRGSGLDPLNEREGKEGAEGGEDGEDGGLSPGVVGSVGHLDAQAAVAAVAALQAGSSVVAAASDDAGARVGAGVDVGVPAVESRTPTPAPGSASVPSIVPGIVPGAPSPRGPGRRVRGTHSLEGAKTTSRPPSTKEEAGLHSPRNIVRRASVALSRFASTKNIKRVGSGRDGRRGSALSAGGAMPPVAEEPEGIQGQLRIVVTDDGVGLSKANQQRLFTEIVQFNPELLQAGGGSGFGLYISKSIVDLHKGSLEVISKGEGQGCSFVLNIPMTRKPVESSRSAADGQAGSVQVLAGIDVGRDGAPLEGGEERTNAHGQVSPGGQAGADPTRHDPLPPSTHPPLTTPQPAHTILTVATQSTLRTTVQAPATLSARATRTDPLRGTQSLTAPVTTGGSFTAALTPLTGPLSSPLVAHAGSTSPTPQSPRLAAKGATSPTPLSPRVAAKSAPAYTGPKYKVLVVDDSALTRKMLVKTLKAAGHESVEAEDGAKGVAAMTSRLRNLDAQPFDCVLMDFVMPVMDGPSATYEIRSLGYKAPIFGVTGNCLDFDIKRFKDSGATEVFPKPFRVDVFHAAMLSSTEDK